MYSCDARTPRRCRIMTRKFHGNDSVLMSLTDENYDIIDIDHCRKSSSPAAPILDTSRIPTPDITAVPMPGCGLAACPGGAKPQALEASGPDREGGLPPRSTAAQYGAHTAQRRSKSLANPTPKPAPNPPIRRYFGLILDFQPSTAFPASVALDAWDSV